LPNTTSASRFGRARPRAIGWNGAGASLIASQQRQDTFSRTCWNGTAAAGTREGRGIDEAGARQVLRQWPARRLARYRRAAGCGWALFGDLQFAGGIRFGSALLQFGQRQLQLLEPGAALRRGVEPLPAQPGDLQLEALDLEVENPLSSVRRSRLRLGGEPRGAQGEDHRVRFGEVSGERIGGGHPRTGSELGTSVSRDLRRERGHPAAVGRQVRFGILQSMPSSR
jgi:hypothetical protein